MNLRVVGTVSRSHGLKGAFKVNITVEASPQFEENEPVFIQLQGEPVPFFVEEISSASSNSIVLKVEDLDTIEATDRFIGLEILLPSGKVPRTLKDEAHSIIGVEVYDIHHGQIGKILGIMHLPKQSVQEEEKEGKQILIPFVEEVVIEIDDENQSVMVETPDGLVDLYMNA